MSRQLDVIAESPTACRVRQELISRVVGQTDAIDALVGLTEKFSSGLYDRTRPIGSLLFIGPTGAGKTRVTEAFAEVLYGNPRQRLKIDCGEYQHSHEIAKLIGSPPGYHGHQETPPVFNTKRVESLYGKQFPFALLVLDEVEKASDVLWHLCLGILDKGYVTNGRNEEVDLTRTIILMTSNAGSSEMSFALGGGMGFNSRIAVIDNKLVSGIGVSAARRKFTPEFINRLDAVVGCNALTKEETREVIYLELARLQSDLYVQCASPFHFNASIGVVESILAEGFDTKYNARNIKRVIDRRIRLPLSRIVATQQCKAGASVSIAVDQDGGFIFTA